MRTQDPIADVLRALATYSLLLLAGVLLALFVLECLPSPAGFIMPQIPTTNEAGASFSSGSAEVGKRLATIGVSAQSLAAGCANPNGKCIPPSGGNIGELNRMQEVRSDARPARNLSAQPARRSKWVTNAARVIGLPTALGGPCAETFGGTNSDKRGAFSSASTALRRGDFVPPSNLPESGADARAGIHVMVHGPAAGTTLTGLTPTRHSSSNLSAPQGGAGSPRTPARQLNSAALNHITTRGSSGTNQSRPLPARSANVRQVPRTHEREHPAPDGEQRQTEVRSVSRETSGMILRPKSYKTLHHAQAAPTVRRAPQEGHAAADSDGRATLMGFASRPQSFLSRLSWAESRNNPRAIGPAGERGLYQMSAVSWQQVNGLRLARGQNAAPFSSAFDPSTATAFAADYLSWLHSYLTRSGLHDPTASQLIAVWNLGPQGFRRAGFFSPHRWPTKTTRLIERFNRGRP